jgi:hypothetical protein
MGYATRMVKMRNSYNILIEKYEGKIHLGKSRCRCKGHIKMDLKKIVCEGVD